MKSRVIVTLMLLMLVVTLQSVFLLPAVNAATHTDITVAKAYDMIYSTDYPNLLVMDVRAATSPPEGTPNFNDEHILGAINVPVLPPPPFDFAALNAWISSPEGQSHKNHEIIVYCPMEGCPRSNMASNILDANGFTKVYDMLGGYLAWTVAGYPIIHVTAAVDITPETLNLKSNGKWVTCYIELPTPTV
jgi:rhodanese-related sulfurtransferase